MLSYSSGRKAAKTLGRVRPVSSDDAADEVPQKAMNDLIGEFTPR
jgi:hypothetical protein